VLEHERMAFPAHRERLVSALAEGNELFIYTTRAAFHNPSRDRGRVIGTARATTTVELLPEPVEAAGRSFPLGCAFELLTLAPLGSGIKLARLVNQLTAFPIKHAWATRMRRPLLQLPAPDATLLRQLLKSTEEPPADVLTQYLAMARHAADAAIMSTRASMKLL
jgi:hypothetical protein